MIRTPALLILAAFATAASVPALACDDSKMSDIAKQASVAPKEATVAVAPEAAKPVVAKSSKPATAPPRRSPTRSPPRPSETTTR